MSPITIMCAFWTFHVVYATMPCGLGLHDMPICSTSSIASSLAAQGQHHMVTKACDNIFMPNSHSAVAHLAHSPSLGVEWWMVL